MQGTFLTLQQRNTFLVISSHDPLVSLSLSLLPPRAGDLCDDLLIPSLDAPRDRLGMRGRSSRSLTVMHTSLMRSSASRLPLCVQLTQYLLLSFSLANAFRKSLSRALRSRESEMSLADSDARIPSLASCINSSSLPSCLPPSPPLCACLRACVCVC